MGNASVAPAPPSPGTTNNNTVFVAASAANSLVDVVLLQQRQGDKNGTYKSKDGDAISWALVENSSKNSSTSFILTLSDNLTWWKGMYVYGDNGQKLCSLEVHDKMKESRCLLSPSSTHELIFSYRIELWKAKILGVHTHVDTLSSSYFGAILGDSVLFKWVNDAEH